jgi:cyclophilin family peptidyl-prolyl cis-trans isomerase
MLKRLIVAALALIFAALPSLASAKDKEQATPPPAPHVYKPIDYNVDDDPANILYLDLSTGKRVTIRLMPSWAPNTVERIKTLTRMGFYDGQIFHRVIDGFMAQTGDPTGTGRGGSNLPNLKEEFNPMPHVRGTVSMARADDPNSANSQFFIMFQPRFALDRKYTNFGRVIAGMDAVDEIARGEPPEHPTKILQASLGDQHKPPPAIAPQQEQTNFTADVLNNSVSEPSSGEAAPPEQQQQQQPAPPEQNEAPAPAPAPAGQ